MKPTVNNGLIPGGFITKMGWHAVFFTVVNLMNDKQSLREKTFCDLSEARIAPYKLLGNIFKTQYLGAIYCPLKMEDCNFTKQGPVRSSSTTHCLQSSLRKMHEN